jgi:hypothetical protein
MYQICCKILKETLLDDDGSLTDLDVVPGDSRNISTHIIGLVSLQIQAEVEGFRVVAVAAVVAPKKNTTPLRLIPRLTDLIAG